MFSWFMDFFKYLFDINCVAFTLWDYPLSWVELVGTTFGLVSVWLTAKEKVACWPLGIINVIFFFILFYQVRLYSDMLLQVVFLISSFYGWRSWLRPRSREEQNQKQELKITILSFKQRGILLFLLVSGTLLLYLFMKDIHIYFPHLFPERAAFPLRDAFTTITSILAQWIMTRKKLECWLLWLFVDLVATVYYFQTGIYFVAIEYIIFGILAVNGGIQWVREYRRCPVHPHIQPATRTS